MTLAASVLATPPEATMRRRLPYAHTQALAFLAACSILGGALGVLWAAFRGGVR